MRFRFIIVALGWWLLGLLGLLGPHGGIHMFCRGAQQDDGSEEWYHRDGKGLMLHLDDRNVKSNRQGLESLKVIGFCVDCPNPDEEGSMTYGLLNYHFLYPEELEFELTSEAVFCVPNYADHKKIINAAQMRNRVVLVKRGKVPLADKVKLILENSSASAIVIIDDGSCSEDFRFCGPRSGSVVEGGFALNDEANSWRSATAPDPVIPVLMVSAATGRRFEQMMLLREVEVLGMGAQNATLLPPSCRSKDEEHDRRARHAAMKGGIPNFGRKHRAFESSSSSSSSRTPVDMEL